MPDREVTDIRPLGCRRRVAGLRSRDRSPRRVAAARAPHAHREGRRGRRRRAGHQQAARAMQAARLAPAMSDRLGHLVRTNSESLLAVTLPDDRLAPWKDVAISASFHPDPDTHIEFVTYGRHGDFMSNLTTLLTGKGTRFTRPLMLLANILRHPVRFAKVTWPFGWGRRTLIILVMQTLDNAIRFGARPACSGAACGSPPSRTKASRTPPTSRPAIAPRSGSPSARAGSRRACCSRRWPTSRRPRTSSAAR